MQDFRRERHSVSKLTVHLVCVTKYRRRILDAAALEWLKGHFTSVAGKMSCELLAADGEADHVHLLVEYPPRLSISVLINTFKGTSARVLRRVRPDIAAKFCKGTLWSPSYFAVSTGGASLEMVKRYVEQQRASSSP
jgi:putative transposase